MVSKIALMENRFFRRASDFSLLFQSLNITQGDFGLMYSVYSLPNTVLVFFGGMVGDRIGLRLSSMIFVSFVCLGTVFVALGPTILKLRQAWMMMVAGRVLLGFGLSRLLYDFLALLLTL